MPAFKTNVNEVSVSWEEGLAFLQDLPVRLGPAGRPGCCIGTTIHIVPTEGITKLRQTSNLNETQV